MNSIVVSLFAIVMIALVAYEGFLAYTDWSFWPSQIKLRGYPQGLPFIAHGGALWGDILIVNPIVVYVLACYGDQWTTWEWLSETTGIMLVANLTMHYVWSRNPKLDCLAWDGALTPAGVIHVVYTGIILTVLGLLYFKTQNIDQTDLTVISFLLGLQVFIGSHKVLDMFNPSWWGRKLNQDLPGWVAIFAIWGLLYWRTGYILSHP